MTATQGLRRALTSRDAATDLETLLTRLRESPDNATFLRQVRPTLPNG